MRLATPRTWWALAIGAAIAIGALGPTHAAIAQEAPAPSSTELPNPAEPTGRAVCNLAFTIAGAVGLSSFVVPGDAPIGPNEVIVGLRPILDACVGEFPPTAPRQCFTSGLYPNTGLPITLPDPLGILTEQLEALTDVLAPLGLPMASPLRDVFESALECRDLEGAAPEDGLTQPVGEEVPGTVGPPITAGSSTTTAPAEAIDEQAAAFVGSPAAQPSSFPLSVVPEPLRGTASIAAVGFVATCAVVFRRLLSPGRTLSILDAETPPRP